MGLELFWSEFAKSKLETIYQYYKLKAGKKIALKIINGIVDRTVNLNKNPEIGRLEDALEDEERKFRYFVLLILDFCPYAAKTSQNISR